MRAKRFSVQKHACVQPCVASGRTCRSAHAFARASSVVPHPYVRMHVGTTPVRTIAYDYAYLLIGIACDALIDTA